MFGKEVNSNTLRDLQMGISNTAKVINTSLVKSFRGFEFAISRIRYVVLWDSLNIKERPTSSFILLERTECSMIRTESHFN